MGGDTTAPHSSVRQTRFNPRPRMGGDDASIEDWVSIWGFNPRPRMGGDTMTISGETNVLRVSIRAPAWGATRVPVP